MTQHPGLFDGLPNPQRGTPSQSANVLDAAKQPSTNQSPKFIVATAPARRNGPKTSKNAARSAEAFAGAQCRMVFDFIASQREFGATDKETQSATGLSCDSQVPRRWTLVRTGQVADSGRTRPTPSGRAAIVWVATAFAAKPEVKREAGRDAQL